MVLERLLWTFTLIATGSGAYLALKHAHVRVLGRMHTNKKTGRPTLVYFRSDHCVACPTQARYLEQLRQRWQGNWAVEEIDADAEPEKAAEFGVFTLPTTVLVDAEGKVREINYGLTNAQKLSRQLAALP